MKYDLKKPYDRQRFTDYCNALYKRCKYVELKEIRPKRSLDQNGLYWMWLSCLEKESELGYTKEDLHAMFKAKWLMFDEDEILKYMQKELFYQIQADADECMWETSHNKWVDCITKSTTKLTTEEMSNYMNQVSGFAMIIGIRLPQPEDKLIEEMVFRYG